jgi:hypothetical protein
MNILIPVSAIQAAARGDKGGTVQFDCPDTPDSDPKNPVLKLTVTCGGMPVETVYHPEPAGDFPNYRQVIPPEFLADVTIPETHRSALISWLRTLNGKSNSTSVHLTWKLPGHLTLTHWDYDTATTTIQVPVSRPEEEGRPPAISFSPKYLADALVIGSTLRLIDGITPGVATDPASGNYCLIMPCRFVAEAGEAEDEAVETAQAA